MNRKKKAEALAAGLLAVSLLVIPTHATELENAADDVQEQSITVGAQNESDGCLANGKSIIEKNVLELLHEIGRDWPTGTVWGTHNTPGTHKNEVPSTTANRVMKHYRVSGTYACGGYASMVSSLVFGDDANPARQVTDLSQIRPGDILFLIRNDNGRLWHVMVALESPNEMNAFHCTDGYNGGQPIQPGEPGLLRERE